MHAFFLSKLANFFREISKKKYSLGIKLTTHDKISFSPKTLYLWLGISSILIGAILSLIIFSTNIFATKQKIEDSLTDHEKRIEALEASNNERLKLLYEIKFNLKSYIESEGKTYYSFDQLNGKHK